MIIQRILTPYKATTSIESLYFNRLHGQISYTENVFNIEANSKVSFNSYINSFYEAYWFEKTNIESVTFEFEVIGSGVIEFFRDTEHHGCNLIHVERFAVDSEKEVETLTVTLSLNRDNLLITAGRIFFDINSITDLSIKSMRVRTKSPIQREINLTIGICTFNRENYLTQNIKDIIELSEKEEFIVKVIIVNQGNSFSNDELKEYLKNPIVQCVEQANLGGTGGFTRSMVEALNYNSSYHLLMDDDIVLDVRLLDRVVAFASFTTETIAIGGQMLDALRPTVMHEYGALIKEDGFIKPLLSNLDLANYGNLYNFNKVVSSDYNAWWFCAIPVEAIKEIDLPAPIFIRGDDEEFGLRLKRSGRETIGLPSVGVWHEPFYMKAGGWQTYYDFRNRFILATVYEGMKPQTTRSLSWSIYSALLNHDYQFAALVIEAINDFSKGDSLFEEPSDKIHSKVMAISKKYAPKNVSNIKFNPPNEEDILKPWMSLPERGLNVVKQSLKNSIPYTKNRKKHLYDRHVHPVNIDGQSYIKTNGVQSYKLLYENNSEVFRYLFLEYIKAIKLYSSTIRDNTVWNYIDNYRRKDHWKKIFELSS